MKKLIVLGFLLIARLNAADGTTARLEKSSSEILPTPYRIRIHLGREIPQSKVGKRMFAIHDKETRDPISIVSVRRASAPDENVPDPTVKTVLLDADLNPARFYLVDIFFPGAEATNLLVTPLQPSSNTNAVPPLINLSARSFKLEANPFVADSDNAIGLKYDVRYDVKDLHPGRGLLRIELQTHGEFSLASENDSQTAIQNSFKGGLNVTYLYNVPAGIPFGKESRAYVYPMGFRIAPAEFEANRRFTLVNYTAKLLAGGAIPYVDYPALLWSEWFNLDVPFFPPTLFTGFTALSEVKDDGTDQLSHLGHTRWDTEFLYFLPLHRRLDFKFSWNWYVGLEKSLWKNSCEAGAILYADDKRTHGFTLSFQEGSLPPEFKHTQSWRIGYTAKF